MLAPTTTSRAFSTPLLIGIGAILILLGVGALTLLSNGEVADQPSAPREVTLAGTSGCLPHRDTSGPQTLECAFGLETGDGSYYALDTRARDTGSLTDLGSGADITVTGTLTPRDALEAADRLLTYDIAGVIAATAITHTESGEGARHVVAGGTLAFLRPADFGLAVSEEQVLVEASVPPCDAQFDYCLYYNGTAYEGTNFESAGVRINERADLATESQCLETPPAGHPALTPEITRTDTYAVSVFAPISDAGAGSLSEGALYRLSHDATCHEFETRVGTTQFANYPAGSITEFATADRAAVHEALAATLTHVEFTDERGAVTFPEPTAE